MTKTVKEQVLFELLKDTDSNIRLRALALLDRIDARREKRKNKAAPGATVRDRAFEAVLEAERKT